MNDFSRIAMRVSQNNEFGYDNYPTVLPVSAGGYGWMFWTARRSWGTYADGIFGNAAASATTNPAGNPSARKLWVSALRLAGNGTSAQSTLDPSYPAFYLEGQGDRPSMRAFAALNACHVDGTPCGSGVDCCSGFCPSGACGTPVTPRCSKTMDACTQSADCCQDELTHACIGGFCDVVVLQ